MSDSTKALCWSIVGYIAIYAFGYSKIVVAEPDLRILFVLVPICLLIWQATILRHRFVQQKEKADSPFYEHINPGDWWRVFLILLSGHNPLASDYVWVSFCSPGLSLSLSDCSSSRCLLNSTGRGQQHHC